MKLKGKIVWQSNLKRHRDGLYEYSVGFETKSMQDVTVTCDIYGDQARLVFDNVTIGDEIEVEKEGVIGEVEEFGGEQVLFLGTVIVKTVKGAKLKDI